ncbi:hypothetical protein [Pedobacter sp. L105]|uniref:hypothetical protein n=1 Tax=Pedobacter sp. L105 TaxID=1641871 RepID=UPI00131B2DDC|nr:hypothetical protein [Pedobacter sp. L105]
MKEQQKEVTPKRPAEPASDAFQPKGPRDGLDNTGTQGKDSLKDDGYTGSSTKDTSGHEDGTVSSSKDFPGSHESEDEKNNETK